VANEKNSGAIATTQYKSKITATAMIASVAQYESKIAATAMIASKQTSDRKTQASLREQKRSRKT
jgi:hypothetical protein